MRVASVLVLLLGVASAEETGTLHGRVLKADGKPWVGSAVTAYSVTSKEPFHRTTKTDVKGEFRFERLPVGKYVLAAGAEPKKRKKPQDDLGRVVEELLEPLFGGIADTVMRANADGHPHLVTVQNDRTVRHDIRLPKRVPITLALTRRGRPFPNAEVQLVGLNKKGKASWTVSVGKRRRPRTDAEGIVRFEAVPEGRYAVSVVSGRWEVGCGTVEVAGSESPTFSIKLGLYSVRVRVVDGQGKPVTKAGLGIVRLQKGPWGGGVRPKDMEEASSANGVYTVPYLHEGRHTAYVNAKSAHVSVRDIDVGPDSPNPEVVLRLPATGTLIVKAVDANGNPVEGVDIRVTDRSEIPGYMYTTNREGEIRPLELTAKTWLVGLTDILDWKGKPQEVEVQPFTETRVKVKVTSADPTD